MKKCDFCDGEHYKGGLCRSCYAEYIADENDGYCEQCQAHTHVEEIPMHGYPLFLCRKCAAAACRAGEAV